jgi:molybdenum cofactor biosynthesis protein B
MSSEGHDDAAHQHRSYAPDSVTCAVITVSDSRTLQQDKSGDLIQALLEAAGHRVVERGIVRDERDEIRALASAAIERSDVDALLVTGGTGVAPRDCTIEAVESLLQKALPGFGELFRQFSFDEIGAAAMLSRATAGVALRADGSGAVVFAMPGSSGGVRTAMERLIVPELAHLVGQLRRTN